MGAESFTVVIHRQGIVYICPTYDAALRLAQDRIARASVSRVEITHDHRIIWASAQEGVIASHDQ